MVNRSSGRSLALAAAASVFLYSGQKSVAAQDAVELLIQGGRVPADMIHGRGYSDFSDPLGRFMDLVAAGTLIEAQSIQAAACESWRATRQNSPLTGKFSAWNTNIDLNVLCAEK